jgi:hypothetical protein
MVEKACQLQCLTCASGFVNPRLRSQLSIYDGKIERRVLRGMSADSWLQSWCLHFSSVHMLD